MTRKKTPGVSTIRSVSGFSNPIDLTVEEVHSITITTPEDVNDVLLPRANWNEGALGVICLNLSPDNLRVANATLLLQGTLIANKIINVSTFWDEAPGVSLSITLDDLTIFNFPDGSLVSEYVASDEFENTFTLDNNILAADELEDAGVSNFCLRSHVYPSTADHAKMVITLYPMPFAKLALNPLHMDTRFPGMSFATKEFQLGPSPILSPLGKPWGFPIVPCLLPGSTFDVAPGIPSGSELRSAMTAFLRSATVPDSKKNLTSFRQAVVQILDDPSSLSSAKLPSIRWPVTVIPRNPITTPTQGWC